MSGYEDDILVWSERQSALLRRLAAGERVNDTDLDWANIAEEVESVGRSELRACESLLQQALLHMLKVAAWPLARGLPHWEAEIRRFRQDAIDAFAPSMSQRIDLARLYARARSRMPSSIDGQPPLPVPTACPATLDELLAEP